jgi:hypothetical protein
MRPVMCAIDKRYIDPGAAGRRESATVDLHLDPAVLKQFARAGHSVQITQQNCLELRCFVPWFAIKMIVTVDDRKLYTRSDNLRTYKYRSLDGTKPQCGSPIPVSRDDDEVPQMLECKYCGFYNVLGAQCCFNYGCRMAQSAEAIEEEMNHYKVEDKASYKRTKYGIGIVKFNVFGPAASSVAPGETCGAAAPSLTDRPVTPPHPDENPVPEAPRGSRGNRFRTLVNMPLNDEVRKHIKRAKKIQDLSTQVLAADGITVLSCSNFQGHADRFDGSEDYRKDMDFHQVPRDLYLKMPRNPNLSGNGPYKRVHAEPEFASKYAPAEFDTDEA